MPVHEQEFDLCQNLDVLDSKDVFKDCLDRHREIWTELRHNLDELDRI